MAAARARIVDAWPVVRLLPPGAAGPPDDLLRVLSSVVDWPAAEALAQGVASAIVSATERTNGQEIAALRVGELFRGVAASVHELNDLPRRAYNCALRSGVNTTARLAETRVQDLIRWSGSGRQTQTALLKFAALAALDGFMRMPDDAPADDDAAAAEDVAAPVVADGVDLPETVRANEVEDLMEEPLALPQTAGEVIGRFRKTLSAREADVLASREFASRGPTLEELGQRYDVTRERIRQIVLRTKRDLQALLETAAGEIIRSRARRLREELGLCATRDAVADALAGDAIDEFGSALMLWQAGPYEQVGDLVVLAPRDKAVAITREILERCVAEDSSLEAVVARLAVVGVSPDAASAWIEAVGDGYRVVDGHLVNPGAKRRSGSDGAAIARETSVVAQEAPLTPARDVRPLPDDYLAWNNALVDALFSSENAGQPVYMDLEDDILHAVAERIGVDAADPRGALVKAVRETLGLEAGVGTFALHEAHLRIWLDRGGSDSPPFVALLAVFSLAAEEMRSDRNFHSHNYYGRLSSVLTIPPQGKVKLQRDFQSKSHLFWEALSQWLRRAGGERGLPTAQAFDRRVHVGLPISQALIRAVDRKPLREMFAEFRLEPGQRISRDDMIRLLEMWVPQAPVTQTLKLLWSAADAKARIAEIACVELEAWDGTIPEASRRAVATRLFLLAAVRRNPRRRIDFAVAVKGTALADGAALSLSSGSGDAAERFVETAGGVLTVGDADGSGVRQLHAAGSLSFPDLLVAHLRLHGGSAEDQDLAREPRNVVVLEHDDENARYVEVDRAELGRDLLLLVSAAKERVVEEALGRVARRGYTRFDSTSLAGLPTGWVAFQGVELIAAPESSDPDLATLQPLLLTQVVLGNGLRLPGHATWHRGAPPEIRVTSLDPKKSLVVSIQDAPTLDSPEPEERELAHGRRLVLVPLEPEQLQDGDYRVVVATREAEIIASAAIHVHSGDTPRELTSEQVVLAHGLSPEHPRGAISGSPEVAGSSIAGARTADLAVAELPDPSRRPPRALDGFDAFDVATERDEAPIGSTERRSGDLPACLTGGAHYFLLPEADAHAPRGLESRGVCTACGYERTFPPPPPWWRRRRPGRRPPQTGAASLQARADELLAANPLPQRVDPIREQRGETDALVLDALSYARAGTWSQLERLAARADDDPWSVSETARLLSALGHVDLALDDETLRPVAWTIGRPSLVAIGEDEAALAGARSDILVATLADAAAEAGGTHQLEDQDSGPPIFRVVGLAPTAVSQIASTLETPHGPMSFEESLPERLVSHLPTLSSVAATLPALPEATIAVEGLERFDFQRSRWERVAVADTPGAYRLSGFPRRYFVLVDGQPRLADNRLVKWIGGLSQGVTMLAYDAGTQQLRVRLGAQLPGLYERVAVLCSGRSPEKLVDGTVSYTGVRQPVADAIFALLSR